MSKIGAIPAQAIIDGFKGVIDYYVHYQTCDRSNAGSGTPCARSWPRSPGRERAPAVEAQWSAFSFATSNWNSLDPYVQEAYKATVQETNLTPRDLFTKAFITDYFRDGQWTAPALPPPPIIEEDIMPPALDIGARVYHNADQSIPNGVPTTIAFNSERKDTDLIHDPVTNNSRLTCNTAGTYQITANLQLQLSAQAFIDFHILLNGITKIAGYHNSVVPVTWWTELLSTTYDLAVNDYVEVVVYQASGAAQPLKYSANISPEFMMQLLNVP